MPSTDARTGWFDGTWALVCSRRQFLLAVPAYAVLLPGLAGGLVLGLLQNGPHREIGEAVAFLVGSVLLGVPLGLGGWWTFGPSAAGLPGRRQELFGLPLGRLAIPGAVLVGSAIAFALAAFAAWVVSATVGEVFVRSLGLVGGKGGAPSPVDVALAALACFGFGFSVGTVGASTAHGPLVLAFPACAACILATVIGHPAPAAGVYAELWLAAMVLYCVAVPFVLYRRPPHHWAVQRVSGQDRPDLRAIATSMFALLALVFAGGGVALVVLALGTGATLLAWRREPVTERRRPWPHLRVAHAAALGLVVPLALVGVIADARLVASAAPANPAVRAAGQCLAPGGRRLAVALSVPGSQLHRVFVLDLKEATEPRLVGGRFASIGGWSSDGRHLAVHDETIGRLPVPFSGLTGSIADAELGWLLRLNDAVAETLVLDTQTGEIVARRQPLLVAPGWTTPAELLHVERRAAAAVVLADGYDRRYTARMRADRVVLPLVAGGEIELRRPSVSGYVDGRPVVQGDDRRWRWGESGLEPIADASGWRVSDDQVEGPIASHTLERGAERLVLRGARDVRTWVADAALVVDADGVYRVGLPGLERERLLERGADALVRVHPPLAGSVAAAVPALENARVVEIGDALHLVTPRGSAKPIAYGTCARRLDLLRWTEPPAVLGLAADGALVAERMARDRGLEPLELLPDGSLLVRDGELRLLLVRPDGTRTNVPGE